MRNEISTNKPAIIIYAFEGFKTILDEITCGMEEEGVFFDILAPEVGASACESAQNGAQNSQLDVGIGIAKDGTTALHYQKMKKPLYQLEPNSALSDFRKLGNNAARLVKGMPLLDI